jgi:hypothetical protein
MYPIDELSRKRKKPFLEVRKETEFSRTAGLYFPGGWCFGICKAAVI